MHWIWTAESSIGWKCEVFCVRDWGEGVAARVKPIRWARDFFKIFCCPMSFFRTSFISNHSQPRNSYYKRFIQAFKDAEKVRPSQPTDAGCISLVTHSHTAMVTFSPGILATRPGQTWQRPGLPEALHFTETILFTRITETVVLGYWWIL